MHNLSEPIFLFIRYVGEGSVIDAEELRLYAEQI
jgi:hypothetical protein